MKKLISLMLTLAMVLSLGITALALGPGESLIIRYEGTLEEFDLIAVFWQEGSEWNTVDGSYYEEHCELLDEAEKLYWCTIPEGTDAVSLAVEYYDEAVGEWVTDHYPGIRTFEEIGSGRLVAPAGLSDGTYVENSSSSTYQSIEVTGTYVPGGGDTETTVSIDLEWGNMNFIYTAGTQVWNPETHVYEYQEGSWAPEEENSNFIMVTNHSDVAVEASLEFMSRLYKGAFMDESQSEVIENLSLDRATEEAKAPRAISYFFITGGTMDEYSAKQLGYINITILAEEGANSGTENGDVATYAPDTESSQRYWQDEGNFLRVGINKNYVDVSSIAPNGNEDADDVFKIDLNGAKIDDEEINDGYTPMYIVRNEDSANYIGVSHCVNDKTDIWIYPFGNEIGVETYVLEYSLDKFVFEEGYTYLDTDVFEEGTVTKAGIRIEITISYEDYASAAIYDPDTQTGVLPAWEPTVIDASADDGIEVIGTTADGTQFGGLADAHYRVLLDGATVSDPTLQLIPLSEMSFIAYQTSADDPHEIDVYFCLEQGDPVLAEVIENYADINGVLPGVSVTYPAEYISLEEGRTLEKYENNSTTYGSMGGLSDHGLNFPWPFRVINYNAE